MNIDEMKQEAEKYVCERNPLVTKKWFIDAFKKYDKGEKIKYLKDCEVAEYEAYLAGAESREKRIAELERKLEQTEKDLADYQFNYPTIKELQKENADLKEEINKIAFARGNLEEENAELKSENQKWKDEWQEQVQKATDEGYARTLQTMQLTKAKEIIKYLCGMVRELNKPNVQLTNIDYSLSEAEQFLSEVDK